MLHGIKSIPSPNQQRRPLPSLLSDSYAIVASLPVHECRPHRGHPVRQPDRWHTVAAGGAQPYSLGR